MRKPRRNHSAAFKARVALEAIRGEKTVAEICAHHEIHPTRVTAWKTELNELHLDLPFYGARKRADRLRREGHEVCRRHVTTLMRRMGIEALYRRPRASSNSQRFIVATRSRCSEATPTSRMASMASKPASSKCWSACRPVGSRSLRSYASGSRNSTSTIEKMGSCQTKR